MTSIVEFDGFYDAARARQIAMGQSAGANTILSEINTLQANIDTAAVGGNITLIVSNTTTMTSSTDYFNAWNDPFAYDAGADKLRRLEMQHVINYFSRLGYSIQRTRNGVNDRFDWNIEW